jgi:hypothetical protein
MKNSERMTKGTITLNQHYRLLHELDIRQILYEAIPIERTDDNVNLEDYFNAMQKELNAQASVWLN